MRTLLFILFFISSATSFGQTYETLSPADKAYVDSLVQRTSMIRQSRKHNQMVSFTEGTINGVLPFFSFLINKLDYRTDNGTDIDPMETKTGYIVNLHKYSKGYQQNKQPLKIVITCVGNTDQLQSAIIYGSLSQLVDIYLDYFEGKVREDRPTQGGLDKTYTYTDEVRIYSDKIVITKHNNTFSGN